MSVPTWKPKNLLTRKPLKIIMKKKYALILLCLAPIWALAQVGEHRNQFAVGFHGGYSLNQVDFIPKVNQTNHKGFTGGLMARYTCEKYFKTICSIQLEFNYAQLGWEEDITVDRFRYSPILPGERKSKAWISSSTQVLYSVSIQETISTRTSHMRLQTLQKEAIKIKRT